MYDSLYSIGQEDVSRWCKGSCVEPRKKSPVAGYCCIRCLAGRPGWNAMQQVDSSGAGPAVAYLTIQPCVAQVVPSKAILDRVDELPCVVCKT